MQGCVNCFGNNFFSAKTFESWFLRWFYAFLKYLISYIYVKLHQIARERFNSFKKWDPVRTVHVKEPIRSRKSHHHDMDIASPNFIYISRLFMSKFETCFSWSAIWDGVEKWTERTVKKQHCMDLHCYFLICTWKKIALCHMLLLRCISMVANVFSQL